MATTAATQVSVRKATPQIGAFIEDIDLSQDLTEEVKAKLRAAIDENLVLFFRDQDLDMDHHVALCEVFAPATGVNTGITLNGKVLIIEKHPDGKPASDNIWHSDQSYKVEPPTYCVLKAVTLPSSGGDTCWASMYAAYDALSSRMQRYLDGLEAIHTGEQTARQVVESGARDASELEHLLKQNAPHRQPIVRTNPENGRKALYVNPLYTAEIPDLPREEGEAILRFLYNHISQPVFHYRFHWEPNSIAIWDNRWTQHQALYDYRETRLMHRVASAGTSIIP
jgi:taurine dioxygenase